MILAVVCLAAGTALRAGERWVRVSSPHFTILTADSTDEARHWALALEVTCREMKQLTGVDADSLDPLTIVVFPDARTFKRVLGPRQAKDDPFVQTSGRSYQHNGRAFIAVNPDDPDVARRTTFLSATLWMTGSFRRAMPLWITSGLQELYSNYELKDGRMKIGWPIEHARLEGKMPFTFDELLTMSLDSAYYRSSAQGYEGSGRFNGAAWALVHFLMVGENGADRPAFLRFLEDLQRGMPQDEALAKAFPEGKAALAKRFERYARAGSFRTVVVASDVVEMERSLGVHGATEAEVQLALGYIVIAGQGLVAAQPYFDRAIALAPHAPETLEAQADLALTANDNDRANEYFARAAEAGSKFYLAHFNPIVDKAQSMIGGELAVDRYDSAIARETVDALKDTIRLHPGFYRAYRAFAGLIGSLNEVNADDGALLAEGLQRYPDKAMIQAGQAAYDLRLGKFVSAKKRIDRLAQGEFESDGTAASYRRKLDLHLQALVNLGWMEKYYAEGKFDQATDLLARLDGAPLAAPELQRKRVVALPLAAWENLTIVKGAIEQKDWDQAETLLASVTAQELPDAIKAEAAKVEAQLAAGKKAAGL